MKLPITLVCSLLLTAALCGKAAYADAEHEALTEQTRKAFMGYFEVAESGFTRGEPHKYLTEDSIFSYHTHGGRHYLGFEAIKDFYAGFTKPGEHWTDPRHRAANRAEVRDFIVDGNTVLITFRARSRIDGQRSGRRGIGGYDVIYLHQYTFEDGKITQMHAFRDSQASDQLYRNHEFLVDLGLR